MIGGYSCVGVLFSAADVLTRVLFLDVLSCVFGKMGYYCCLCQAETSAVTVKDFLQHFHCRHGIAKYDKIKLCCSQDSCMRTFDNLKSVGQHIRRSHPISNGSGLVSDQCRSLALDSNEEAADSGNEFSHKESDIQADLKEDIAHVVLRAQMKLGQSNLVSDGIKQVLIAVKDHFSQKLNIVLKNVPPPQADLKLQLSDVLKDVESLPNTVQEVSSVYFRNKLLSTKMGLVEPVECQLGTHYENRYSKETGLLQQVPVADTFQYVPILKTIQFVLRFMLRSGKECGSAADLLTEYCDGNRFQNSNFFRENPRAFQVHLYFDEFETANPLGSKTKIHKLGGIYMMLRNIPSYLELEIETHTLG